VDVEVSCSTEAGSNADAPLTCNDPFYAKDGSSIAAFTFDYEKFDRRLTWTCRVLCFSIVWVTAREIFLFLVVNNDNYDDGIPEVSIVSSLSFWFFLFCAEKYVFDRSKQN
jgi:hypothetical protein